MGWKAQGLMYVTGNTVIATRSHECKRTISYLSVKLNCGKNRSAVNKRASKEKYIYIICPSHGSVPFHSSL